MDELKYNNEKIKQLEETISDLEIKLNDRLAKYQLLENDFNNYKATLTTTTTSSSSTSTPLTTATTTTTVPLSPTTTNTTSVHNRLINKKDIYENDVINKENLNRLIASPNQNSNTELSSSNNSHSNDYFILKDECSQLKIRIQAIEDEMKKFLKLFLTKYLFLYILYKVSNFCLFFSFFNKIIEQVSKKINYHMIILIYKSLISN